MLTYGDGFFNINPDAAMTKFAYVKGTRSPVVVLDADPTDGPAPLTVQFSSEGTHDPDPADSITFAWDFDDDGTIDSMDPNPAFEYTTIGQCTARLTVTGLERQEHVGEHNDYGRQYLSDGDRGRAVDGGLFAFGDTIPFTVTVTDPEDGPIDCSRVEVTFVLGHDEHGHAEESENGCSGVLPTDPADVGHGGSAGVFRVPDTGSA